MRQQAAPNRDDHFYRLMSFAGEANCWIVCYCGWMGEASSAEDAIELWDRHAHPLAVAANQ